MQRITITMDDSLAAELDAFIETSGAFNRSEAIRDLVRAGLSRRQHEHKDAGCFGVLSYAIDHSIRDLARRVPQGRLDRHDQTLATLSVPVDHSTSVDVVVMHGAVGSISDYASGLFLERGIRHGALSLVPIGAESHSHAHEHDEAAAPHRHLRVQETF